MTNRHGLAAWSLEIDDARFAQACAALGILNATARRQRRRRIDLLEQVAAERTEAHRIAAVAAVLRHMRASDKVVVWEMPALAGLARFPSASVCWPQHGRSMSTTCLGARVSR